MNFDITSEYLNVNFAEVVDVEWKLLQCVNSKELNSILEPRILLSLYILTNDFDTSLNSDASIYNNFNKLQIKTIEFECTLEETQYLLEKVQDACNQVQTKLKLLI